MSDDENTPLEWWTTAHDARVKARRAFFRGLLIGGAVIWIADYALSETIQIGRIGFINGQYQDSTTVSIEPSAEPGEWATVTLNNRLVNDGNDTAEYVVMMDGVPVGISFTWDASPVSGADQIIVTPPAGMLCLPADCTATVPEGQTGQVVILDWVGF